VHPSCSGPLTWAPGSHNPIRTVMCITNGRQTNLAAGNQQNSSPRCTGHLGHEAVDVVKSVIDKQRVFSTGHLSEFACRPVGRVQLSTAIVNASSSSNLNRFYVGDILHNQLYDFWRHFRFLLLCAHTPTACDWRRFDGISGNVYTLPTGLLQRSVCWNSWRQDKKATVGAEYCGSSIVRGSIPRPLYANSTLHSLQLVMSTGAARSSGKRPKSSIQSSLTGQ